MAGKIKVQGDMTKLHGHAGVGPGRPGRRRDGRWYLEDITRSRRTVDGESRWPPSAATSRDKGDSMHRITLLYALGLHRQLHEQALSRPKPATNAPTR